MGLPIPPEETEIEPTKYYSCNLKMSPYSDCHEYQSTMHCCKLGSEITDYILDGYTCRLMCICGPWGYWTLISITGPYNTLESCNLENP